MFYFQREEKETAHLGIIQNFVNAILHDEPLLSPGYDGISCVELINAAYLSQWTDQWVSLPVDPKLYLQGLQKKQLEEKQLQKTASDASVTEAKEYLPRWDVRW